MDHKAIVTELRQTVPCPSQHTKVGVCPICQNTGEVETFILTPPVPVIAWTLTPDLSKYKTNHEGVEYCVVTTALQTARVYINGEYQYTAPVYNPPYAFLYCNAYAALHRRAQAASKEVAASEELNKLTACLRELLVAHGVKHAGEEASFMIDAVHDHMVERSEDATALVWVAREAVNLIKSDLIGSAWKKACATFIKRAEEAIKNHVELGK